MDKQDVLLEIGCEELPTHAVKSLANQFRERFVAQLTLCGLIGERETINGFLMTSSSTEAEVFATPRRIAILVKNIATQLVPQIIERQGPSYDKAFDSHGNPTAA